MKRPVILVSVFRRYHELAKNLLQIQQCQDAFAVKPLIWVIWAAPELGRLWFFQQLLHDGTIHRVLTRPNIIGADDGHGDTTMLESININLGLDRVFAAVPDAYVLYQTADITITKTIASIVDAKMQAGADVFAVYWPNHAAPGSCFHTNFFAISDKPEYRPPLVPQNNNADVLERIWWLKIAGLPNIATFSNPDGRFFVHSHESEGLPPFADLPQIRRGQLSLSICGYVPWWKRLGVWLWRRLVLWQKSI